MAPVLLPYVPAGQSLAVIRSSQYDPMGHIRTSGFDRVLPSWHKYPSVQSVQEVADVLLYFPAGHITGFLDESAQK